MLEHHVHALLARQLAHHALEPVLAVVDDVIGAERGGLGRLLGGADGGDDGAADRLGDADGDAADARAAGVHQHGLARLQAAHCRTACARPCRRPLRRRRHRASRRRRASARAGGPGWLVRSCAKSVDMEAAHAADVLAQIVAPAQAGSADAAGQRGVRDDAVARLHAGYVRANGDDLAGGFGADGQRVEALGERHAAKTPDVDMVQADRLDAQLHLICAGRRRRFGLHEFDLPVGQQAQRADRWSWSKS